MKIFKSLVLVFSAFILLGCATVQKFEYGTILSFQPTTYTVNDPNLTAAALGAALGGVAGNQVGKGNGKKVATLAGVLGGAMVGANINSKKQVNGYKVTVRKDDGSLLEVNTQESQFFINQRVVITRDGIKPI
jgi:outer membrane lipoprotein SlyB